MQHISDEDLILQYYGEETADGSGHMAACPDCRARYQSLQRTLNVVDLPVPDRAADYGSQVWARLSPKLGVRRTWTVPRWIAVAVMASLAMVAFIAGRFLPTAEAPLADGRERVLIGAVGDHLERSQYVLAEVVNEGSVERERARALIDGNRLYRTAARASGDASIAMLLDDLERVLVEIANSPDQDLDALRERIERKGLMLQIRVIASRIKHDMESEKL